jgi:hypothetical protein
MLDCRFRQTAPARKKWRIDGRIRPSMRARSIF